MRYLVVAATVCVSACGGGGGSSTPTTPSPSPTPTPTNRNPSISLASVTPTFGIDTLTTFTFTCTASDADGDAIAYAWTFSDGYVGSGATVQRNYPAGGNFTATVRADDGKGGTAQQTVSLTVGSLTGRWRGVWGPYDFTMDLVQNGPSVTGTYTDRDGPGRTDPAEPGAIDAQGQFAIRIKQGNFGDWYFRGTIETNGRRATGTVSGPGLSGSGPFTMDKM